MEVFLFVTIGWIVSVCLHEFGHAIVAYKGGDYTVKEKGYLTLNPFRYTHPLYSFVMPLLFLFLGGIGLPGGAVYIQKELLRSNGWRTAVSLAGVYMNIVLTFLLCLPFWFGLVKTTSPGWLAPALAFLIQLQICGVLFNLLPVPPLDGFQALAPWLPEHITTPLYRNANTILFVVFMLFWYVPAMNHALWDSVFAISRAFGVEPLLGYEGHMLFKFWERR